jgi:phosphate transport system permease protein
LRARVFVERVIRWLLVIASLVSIMTTVGIIAAILFESIRFFEIVPFTSFITGTQWAPENSFLIGAGRGAEQAAEPMFGALPLLAGTFMITLIAMAVAVPIGLLAAIYMAEYASPRLRGVAKPVLEILAGIPTVVYGFFAAITVAPAIVEYAAMLGLEASFENALAPGLVMGIMIIPFISSLSDDVINAVPNSMREGSLALGTTKAETIRKVVLPAAMPGIVSAGLLGVSRALGETMIVVMAAGLRPNLSANPLEGMTTVTVRIVSALVGDQAFDSPETLSAFALGLVLFCVTLVLNVVATFIIRRFRQKYEL